MRTLRFALPSLLGVAMFLVPYRTADGVNIGLGILTDWTEALLGDSLRVIVVVIVCVSATLSAFAAVARPAWSRRPGGLAAVLAGSRTSAAVRVVAAVVACLIIFGAGPAWITSADTGGVILNDLMTVIVVVFAAAHPRHPSRPLYPFLTETTKQDCRKGHGLRELRRFRGETPPPARSAPNLSDSGRSQRRFRPPDRRVSPDVSLFRSSRVRGRDLQTPMDRGSPPTCPGWRAFDQVRGLDWLPMLGCLDLDTNGGCHAGSSAVNRTNASR